MVGFISSLAVDDRGVIVQHFCRACGYGFLKSAHRECCSARCAEYLAAGYPDKAAQGRLDDPFRDHSRFGPVAILTAPPAPGLCPSPATAGAAYKEGLIGAATLRRSPRQLNYS